MAKTIWIISLFEPTPPDGSRPMRFMGFADEAIKQGYKIRQFSSTFRHSKKIYRHEKPTEVIVNENYVVDYIYSPSYKKNISLKRVYSHYKYSKGLINKIDKLEKPEFILVAFPAISPALAITQWGYKNGVPVFVDIIDPWPDVTLRLLPSSVRPLVKPFFSPFYSQLRRMFESATGVVAISREYTEWAKNMAPKLKNTGVFFPSVPLSEVQSSVQHFKSELGELNSVGVLKLVYAGNLGIAADIPLILAVARRFNETHPGKTLFQIAGSGDYEPDIIKATSENPNIKFWGRIGNDDLMKLYAQSDVGLAQYSIGATQSITYKLFDYLSAGLPILNSLLTEMGDLIRDNRLGLNNEPGNEEELYRNILKLIEHPELVSEYSENGVEFTEEFGDNSRVYLKMLNFFENK